MQRCNTSRERSRFWGGHTLVLRKKNLALRILLNSDVIGVEKPVECGLDVEILRLQIVDGY